FPGSDQPIHIPSNQFVASFSREGGKLAPVFDPRVDPTVTNEVTLFGSADAPDTVLRIASRMCPAGTNAGMPCTGAADCPGSTCEPLFDFSTRFASGVGPVVVPRFGAGVCQDTSQPCTDDASCGGSRCVAYRAVAKDPVPLDGLIETDN